MADNRNATITLGDALLTLVVDRYAAANPSRFAGSQTTEGVTVSYQPQDPPAVALGPQPDGVSNLAVTFPNVTATISGEGGSGTQPLQVVLTGQLAIAGGTLSIGNVSATVTGAAGWLDRKFSQYFDDVIARQYASSLRDVQLPRLENLLGSGIDVAVADATVSAGLCTLHASLQWKGNGNPGPSPPPVALGAGPLVGLALNHAAVQMFIQSVSASQFPMVRSYATKEEKLGTGFKAELDAKIDAPNANGIIVIEPTLTLTIINLIKDIPMTFSPPVMPVAETAITFGIEGRGAAAVADLSAAQTVIQYPLSWPVPFNAIQNAIESWLRESVQPPLSAAIASKVGGLHPTLFTLPSTLPGTNLSATLTFDSLSMTNGNVNAVVRVSA